MGKKTFELRKNDRNFRQGDTLELREYDVYKGYTGASMTVTVNYVLKDVPEYGIIDGYCIMSISSPITIVDL